MLIPYQPTPTIYYRPFPSMEGHSSRTTLAMVELHIGGLQARGEVGLVGTGLESSNLEQTGLERASVDAESTGTIMDDGTR
jgi:hypothetical protein